MHYAVTAVYMLVYTIPQDLLSLQELCEDGRVSGDKSLYLNAQEELLECRRSIDNLEVKSIHLFHVSVQSTCMVKRLNAWLPT